MSAAADTIEAVRAAARARSRSVSTTLAAQAGTNLAAVKASKENPYAVYAEDPIGFAERVLKVTLTEDQKLFLLSIRDNRRTAVKASHAIGKTFVAAVAAAWWYYCFDEHIVYITAPTWKQALGLTFKQVRRLVRAAGLPGDILDTGLIRDENKYRADAHFIKALNAESGEGFQGEHSAPILIIIEEGVGVPRYIWEASEGLMTHPSCRVFAIGNPTDDANNFGEACDSDLFETFSIRALDHPNIVAELRGVAPPFPDAVRLLWLYEMMKEEAEPLGEPVEDAFKFFDLEAVRRAAVDGVPLPDDAGEVWYLPTPFFQGRVLGEFPSQAESQVIPKGWLVSQPVLLPEGEAEIGVDVARFGDDRTTLFMRRGACILKAVELRKFDTTAVDGAILEMINEAAHTTGQPPKRVLVKIDVTGGLGTGSLDNLSAAGYRIVGVNSSSRAANVEQFKNKRSELWFTTRGRVREKRLDLSRLPPDIKRRLIKELSAPKYEIKEGKKVVEDKKKLKERLGYSPDLADGLNLCFAPVVELDDIPRSTSSRMFA